MAFDLVQYFAEQIKIQKPQLLNQYPANEKNKLIDEVNILTLGKLISLWRQDDNKIYHEIGEIIEGMKKSSQASDRNFIIMLLDIGQKLNINTEFYRSMLDKVLVNK